MGISGLNGNTHYGPKLLFWISSLSWMKLDVAKSARGFRQLKAKGRQDGPPFLLSSCAADGGYGLTVIVVDGKSLVKSVVPPNLLLSR